MTRPGKNPSQRVGRRARLVQAPPRSLRVLRFLPAYTENQALKTGLRKSPPSASTSKRLPLLRQNAILPLSERAKDSLELAVILRLDQLLRHQFTPRSHHFVLSMESSPKPLPRFLDFD